MGKPRFGSRLRDIIRAIEHCEDALDGEDFGSFVDNVVLQAAVERFIERISEASRHIPMELTAQFPEIPWGDVRTIGNVLRHEYNRIDPLVSWRMATASLPGLKIVVQRMLESQPVDGKPGRKKQKKRNP
jgi:uncharacterized protein with HEPN domain